MYNHADMMLGMFMLGIFGIVCIVVLAAAIFTEEPKE